MLSIIVAVAANQVIGNNNQLIWHLREDLQHFKQITTGHHVIMGRKTYESIAKPLPNRTNIVLSRTPNYDAPGCTVYTSLTDALKQIDQQIGFIIGGSAIYEQSLPLVNCVYLTRIHKDYEGDSYFPNLDLSEWTLLDEIYFERGVQFEYPYSFMKYVRKK